MNRIYIALIILLLVCIIGLLFLRNTTEHFSVHQEDNGIPLLDWTKFIGMWAPKQKEWQYKLKQDGSFYTPQGTLLPLNGEAKTMLLQNDDAPNVDGADGSPQALSVFAYNHYSPECCYGDNGNYSTSGGCVCVTPKQRAWFASVANNRAGGYLGID